MNKKLLFLLGLLTISAVAVSDDGFHDLENDTNRNSEMALEERPAEDSDKRWRGTFQMYHESDINVNRDNVTDIGFVFRADDDHTGMFYQYELLTTSITEDASERERHNFRLGKTDMFDLAGMRITPYYQYRYEDHTKGSTNNRYQHRIGYSGKHDNGLAFWGYSSYDRYEKHGTGTDQTGYYGEHEVLYTHDFAGGYYVTPSIFNEYQTLNDTSFNNTQARLEAGKRNPLPYISKLGVFSEVDLHRQETDRNDSDNNYDGTVYTFGVRTNADINEDLGLWSEVSYSNNAAGSSTTNNAEQVYVETGVTYRF